jgi:Amt family ammonium transporter
VEILMKLSRQFSKWEDTMIKKALVAMVVGFVLAFVAYSVGQATGPTTIPDSSKSIVTAPAPAASPAPPPAAPSAVAKLDSGDTAWMIVATALVMLMTLPGLALFYGGIAKRKDTLNVIAMSFVTFCIVSILWVVYGYTFAFGTDVHGILGNAQKFMMNGIKVDSLSGTIPEMIFVVFQLTFAAITVALASGAYIERMKFSAWILFSILWMTLVYVPVAHWVWGNGFLAKMGALDFAGGTVVHINAGIAALIGALFLGKRNEPGLIPNNLTATVTGAGLLWFGWFGFNAGSALAANGLAGAAFINTNTATAMAAISWMVTEWFFNKKPTVLGLASGAVAGLVAITPAAGFVNVGGSLIIGLLAGIVCYVMVAFVKARLRYDDTLDAFGIHGIGGTLGALLTGFFADPAINAAGKGLFYGNPAQVKIQLIAIGTTIGYDAVVTTIIFLIIKAVVGLRVTAEEEMVGMDQSAHGERALN